MTREMREKALARRHLKQGEVWSEHTKELQPLKVGAVVQIQNQAGPRSKKWEKSGVVTEVLQHQQYNVRVDGSGRVTLRNRRFLKPILPFSPPQAVGEEKTKYGTRDEVVKQAKEKNVQVVERPRRDVRGPERFQAGQ